MADLRIVDAPEIPTENITGEEKLPTGGSGNYSISLDSLADYTKTKKDLVDNTSVDTKVNGVRQELDTHIEDLLNPHQVTKGQIGLGNVDNTADADKPVSNSTQAAIISAVSPKADKSYVDNQLTLKANKADVYTKQETYTKQESNDLVNNSISTALTPVNDSLDLAKRGIANRYDPLLTYNSGERVILTNGDIVKSTIDGNTNDPNVTMLGWVDFGNYSTVNSIQGLTSIQNPKDGERFYVESYHSGFNKGGRYFTYDATKTSINNGVNIFNGWVGDGDSTIIDAFESGCVAEGDHSSYLDHDGMRRIAKYIADQYALGVTSFRVIFPKGNYIVQKQADTLTTDFRQLAEDSFKLVSLPNLKLTLSYESATFTVRNGLRVGSFNRSDWSKYTGSSPFYGNASTFFMTPNHPFVIVDINTLIVHGVADWDGNTPNLIIGGYYGDNGIQWSGNGCYFANIDRLVIDADIFSHDQSGDGFYIAGRNPSDVKEDLSDGRYMYIRGLEATRNGRNGISFVGGKNSSWYDCKSYKNGLADHPTASNPRSNLDIEAEVSAIRRARFYNFKSNQAGSDGVVSAYQDSRDVIFYDSEFINKQRSVWIEKPQFKFYNCYFNGSIIGGYTATVEEDRTRYIECIFEDDITKNPNMPIAPYLIQQNAKNAIFERCTFNSYLGRLFWVSSTPQGKYTTLKDCVINFYAHVPESIFGVYEFDGVTIYDKRADPSVSMSLAILNALFKDVKILCDTQLSGITVSGTNNFDIYPQNLNQYVKTVASNYQASRFESPVQLMPRYTTSFMYSDVSFIKFAYLNAITDLKRNVLYNKGDTFHCTDPVAQNGVIKWVCTTGGYYNTTGWVASTAYTVNAYVNANGKVYKCTVAGTSGTTAPNHTSGTATDGTVTWEYVGVLSVFTAYGNKATGLTSTSTAADIVAALKAAGLAT